MSSRRVFLLSVCIAALFGAQACATEGELNPQPLPPEPGKGGDNGSEGTGGFNDPTGGADAAIPSTTTDSGCPDGAAGDAMVDDDGGIEAGPLFDGDASCGDGG